MRSFWDIASRPPLRLQEIMVDESQEDPPIVEVMGEKGRGGRARPGVRLGGCWCRGGGDGEESRLDASPNIDGNKVEGSW